MKLTVKDILIRASSFWLLAAGIGVTLLWFPVRHLASSQPSVTNAYRLNKAIEQVKPEDITTLREEIESLKRDRRELEAYAEKISKEIAQLRSQTESMNQKHVAVEPQLGPTEEIERAATRMQAQGELVEGTLRIETVDPQWTSGAEADLREAFHKEDMQGFQLGAVTCRTTLCRMELTLEGVSPPEGSLTRLAHSMPWQGQGFVRRGQGEEGGIVLYLSREGYSLPRLPD